MTETVIGAEKRGAGLSKSDDDDSDDSGVMKDVKKKRSEGVYLTENNAEETASTHKHNSDYGERSPTKAKASRTQNDDSKVIFNVGDLVWARAMNSTYYPCVVTPDPHFKFHTKIVKADPGNLGNKSGSSPEDGQRQYHVHYLGENKRVWLYDNFIMPYRGLAQYEKLVVEDLQNINKIYKPKTEASKLAWREGVQIAQGMEDLSNRERVAKCDLARILERGGDKVLQKKMEIEKEKQRRTSSSDKSPEKFKSPSSPRKRIDLDEKKKSLQYNRKDELAYKMSRLSDSDKKRKSSDDAEKKLNAYKPFVSFNVFENKSAPTFNRSFKIKSDPKPLKEEQETDSSSDENRKVLSDSPIRETSFSLRDLNGSSRKQVRIQEDRKENNKTENEKEDFGERVSDKTMISENLSEGSLVWAKQRGYPFWPAVIARDPKDGEFVKFPNLSESNSQYKSQRKMHVLFLEYNNQRAWLPSSALKSYTTKSQFEAEAVKAGAARKKDFVPGKRYQGQFLRAIEFSETLAKLPDEDRLEAVFQKYGWVMVTEPEHVGSIGNIGTSSPGQKSKKRKLTPESEEDLVNKSTDSETDQVQRAERNSGGGAAMQRLTSTDRRSSAEAETRLDPAVDPVDGDIDPSVRPQPSLPLEGNKKKRESSLVAAIALNGDSSSDENFSDSEDRGPNKAKRRPASGKSKHSRISQSKSETSTFNVPPAVNSSAILAARAPGDDEFPRLGDVIWGRMSGFPFWPSFVTKSPQGPYKKVGANGKANYHVQFFNWNDESGWVNAALEFEGLDAFKKIAAKKKSDKSYNPTKGAMYNKWERAARDAEETMDLTRSERLDCYLVSYGSNQAKKAPSKPSPPTRSSKPATPKSRKPDAPNAAYPHSNSVPRRKPGPASRTGLAPSPTRATGGQLPAGWRIRDTNEGDQTFISPDGREFQDKLAALRYIATCSGPGPRVEYLTDPTLPSGWKCQKIQDSIYYFSSRGERFETRDGVAARLEEEGVNKDIIDRVRKGGRKRRIGPKSVLRKIGYNVHGDESDDGSSTSEDDDPVTISRLPNGLKFRKGGRMDEYLDIDKLFDPSNGGLIEMVQLPDIFLGHPTVRVTESDNEMVISDVDTGEFIAKKIIYD